MAFSRNGRFFLLALLLEAGFLALLWLGDLQQHVVEFVAVYLAVSLFYLLCCFLITRPSPGPPDRWLLGMIWTGGLVFRLTVAPLDPGLSEDLYRYRWQGQLQAAGGNPYTEVPEDPRWRSLRDPTWPRVTRKDLPSVYGPLLEHLYHVWYRVVSVLTVDEFQQAWLFKFPFALAELALAAVLARLLAAMGRPPTWLLIYWWSPLAVVEYWAQGHNDPVAVTFVLLALLAALKDRWMVAFAGLTLATLAKFWPALLFPFFLLRRAQGRWRLRWKPALVTIPIALLVGGPYLQDLHQVTDLLEGFLGGWRNNDSLYGLIYDAVGRDFDRGSVIVARLLVLALAILWSLQLSLLRAAQWVVVILLFLSANCFPWYLGWMLPFLAIFPNAALLLWTALVCLSYHILIQYHALGVWQDSDEFRALEYLPVYGLLLAGGLARGLPRLWQRWQLSRGR